MFRERLLKMRSVEASCLMHTIDGALMRIDTHHLICLVVSASIAQHMLPHQQPEIDKAINPPIDHGVSRSISKGEGSVQSVMHAKSIQRPHAIGTKCNGCPNFSQLRCSLVYLDLDTGMVP